MTTVKCYPAHKWILRGVSSVVAAGAIMTMLIYLRYLPIEPIVPNERIAAHWLDQAALLLDGRSLSISMVVAGVLLAGQRWFFASRIAALIHERDNINIAINNMSHGLLLFDSSEKIVLCNRSFIKMHGLSSDVVRPGCSFRDVIRHRKETGSLADDVDEHCTSIRRRISAGQATQTTMVTASGRTINVLDKPLARGGWVSTHEDVTERHQLLTAQGEAEQLLREQKVQLDGALQNMMQGLCMFDGTGRIVLLNDRYAEMMGHTAEDLAGLSLLDVFKRRKANGKFLGDPAQIFSEVLAGVRSGRATTKVMRSDDTQSLRVVHQPMPNGGWVATFEDITEQRKLEEERDGDREFLKQIINSVPAAIFVKDAHTLKYSLINQTGLEIFGVSRESIIGKTIHEVFSEDAANVISEHDRQLLASDGSLNYEAYLLETPGKGARYISSKKLIIPDAKGAPRHLLAVIEDVTDRKVSDERIAHLAHYDVLTDLPNRALFQDQLERTLKLVGPGHQLALLYLDLDHFKTVNDTLGHPAGDELLKGVAARLRGCLRSTDMIARLGGDEFAVIQFPIGRRSDAEELARRIQVEVKKPYAYCGQYLTADSSIGIALAPDDGTDPIQLLKNADLAMYAAKADGRGKSRFFEAQMDARVRARRALECDLRTAIADGQFELHYQPLVGILDGRITGCEALLRWCHPQHGMISPTEFIPIAEETGMIGALGKWVLRTACAEAGTWPGHIKLAVNISPAQFDHDLVQTVADALIESGLSPERLELEITETVLIGDDDLALAMLHRLRDLGVRIAMDDFGTGYSSLSYLQRFPFDKIKIDRCFIKDIAESGGSQSIVQAVISIAKARDIITTAEGVETEQQLRSLRALGCTEMQGYLVSKPKPAAEISALMGAQQAGTLAVA